MFCWSPEKKKKMKSHLIWPAADPHGGLMQSEHPAELNTMKQLTFSFSYRQGHALKRDCGIGLARAETWQSCDLRISLQEIWIWWWVIRYKMAKVRMKGDPGARLWGGAGTGHSSALASAEVDPLIAGKGKNQALQWKMVTFNRVMTQLETAVTAVRTLPIVPRALFLKRSSSMIFNLSWFTWVHFLVGVQIKAECTDNYRSEAGFSLPLPGDSQEESWGQTDPLSSMWHSKGCAHPIVSAVTSIQRPKQMLSWWSLIPQPAQQMLQVARPHGAALALR